MYRCVTAFIYYYYFHNYPHPQLIGFLMTNSRFERGSCAFNSRSSTTIFHTYPRSFQNLSRSPQFTSHDNFTTYTPGCFTNIVVENFSHKRIYLMDITYQGTCNLANSKILGLFSSYYLHFNGI